MTRFNGPLIDGIHDGIDFDGRYTVAGMPGVAFYLTGWVQAETPESWDVCCDDDSVEHDHDYGHGCYAYGEPELVDDYGMVRAVMVGDDREHPVDRDDLTLISDEDYCGGCGQTGCKAYA